jgi:hypothetical protein
MVLKNRLENSTKTLDNINPKNKNSILPFFFIFTINIKENI